MGRKTVRWKDIKNKVETHCCECDETGFRELWDAIYHRTFYVYCDCKWGNALRKQDESERKRPK